jgi:hypothetical protein
VETVEKSQNIFPPFPQRLQKRYNQLPKAFHKEAAHYSFLLGTMENSPSKALRVSHSSKNSTVSPISPNTVTYLSEPYMDKEGVKA